MSAPGRVILVGGGLANCLIALRLKALRPEVPLLLLESGPTLGGNHTWSFHGTDVPEPVARWLKPLADHRWEGHEVQFPQRRRRLAGSYHSLTDQGLHRATLTAVGPAVRLRTTVTRVTPDGVTLEDGSTESAALVLDGRGLSGHEPVVGLVLRYQKFLGQVVVLAAPHHLSAPLLMDATVTQEQGYRFMYLLPFGPDRLLMEDTYFSDAPDLDVPELRRNIADYAAARGWILRDVEREETGVLPIVLDGDPEAFWSVAEAGTPRTGLRAGLFHHTTGYSLPEAAALAEELPEQQNLSSAAIGPWIRARCLRRWREQRLFRLLNRMLFLAALPSERYRVLQHFYRLPEATIGRFYAGRLNAWDAARILTGAPPVPIHRALRALHPKSSHPASTRGGPP